MKSFIHVFLSLLTMLVLCGCGTKHVHNFYPEEKFVSYGEVGEIKTVLVGDSILHVQKEILTDILEVTKHIEEYNISIPKGRYLKTGEHGTTAFFSPKSMSGRWVRIDGLPLEGGWLEYRLNEKKFFPDSDAMVCLVTFTDGRILKNHRVKEVNTDYLLRSLSYGGAKKQYISFVFKEGDTQHSMTLDTTRSKIFSYQGCKIKVLEFDQDSLTCQILSPLDIFN